MMTTIVGPLKTEWQASDTASNLGDDCSVYSRSIVDAEGYDTGERAWYVERNDEIPSNRIFGFDAAKFMRRQYRKVNR